MFYSLLSHLLNFCVILNLASAFLLQQSRYDLLFSSVRIDPSGRLSLLFEIIANGEVIVKKIKFLLHVYQTKNP